MLSTVFPSPRFIPDFLKNGDLTQLQLWNGTKGNSIYVKWIPDEMDEAAARYFFKQIGTISRIEFASHKNGKNRMMFVHFEEWAMTQLSQNIRNEICSLHPAEYQYPVVFLNKGPKEYQLKCCINMRPIPIVEYSTNQLSDMISIVDKKSSTEIESLREQIEIIRDELSKLRDTLKERDDTILQLTGDIDLLKVGLKSKPETDIEEGIEKV